MRKKYTPTQILQIEAMGSLSMSVANRWIKGWRDRVAALFAAGTFFDYLASQVEREKDVLADERTCGTWHDMKICSFTKLERRRHGRTQ